MRKSLVLAVAALSTAGLGALIPTAANAAGGSTTATFTLTGNSTLAMSVPSSPVNLGSAATGATSLSGSLGNVTVTDQRGALPATWTASAVSSAFANTTTGGSSADETVAAGNVGYFAGVGTAQAGQVGLFVPQGTALTPVAIGSSTAIGAWTAGVGNDTVTWNPTITLTLRASQVAGTYSGTITHSVS